MSAGLCFASGYEFSIYRKQVSPFSAAAIVVVLFLVALVCLGFWKVRSTPREVLELRRTKMIWGVYYQGLAYSSRFYFVYSLLERFAISFLIGVLCDFPVSQASFLIVITLIGLILMLLLRPYEPEKKTWMWASLSVKVLRIVKMILTLIALTSTSEDSNYSLGVAIIVVNVISLVIVVGYATHKVGSLVLKYFKRYKNASTERNRVQLSTAPNHPQPLETLTAMGDKPQAVETIQAQAK
jgi:hypothetical protein